MIASGSFYFTRGKLIKVEEFVAEGEKNETFDWYFIDDKPLYYSSKSEKAAERARQLLLISDAMHKKFGK